MVDWHPSRLAQPVEWMLQHPVSPRPFAVIRLIRFPAQKGTVDAWYRVVTWSQKSADRELVGWCLSLEAACEAAWDYFRAMSSWQHAQAATRMHERPGGAPPKPPAHDLLLAYRAAAREAERGGAVRPVRHAEAGRRQAPAESGAPEARPVVGPGSVVPTQARSHDPRSVPPPGRSLRNPSPVRQPVRTR